MKIDIQELVREAVISDQTASSIQQYYDNKPSTASSRMLLIGSILGGLLVSAGVILLFAHNWDEFSTTTKLILSFLPLVIGQAGVLFGVFKQKSQAFIEGMSSFLFLSVGAAISLVAQVFNISGDLPSFLMTWALLGLPLVYMLRSSSAVLIYLGLVGYYACVDQTLISIIMFAAAIPHFLIGLRKNPESNFVTFQRWTLPIVGALVLIQFVKELEITAMLMYFIYANVVYLLGVVVKLSPKNRFKNGFRILGGLGMLIILFITSYWKIWKMISHDISFSGEGTIMMVLLAGVAAVIMFLSLKNQIKLEGVLSLKMMIPVFTLLFLIGSNDAIASVGVNFVLIGIALESIKKGLDQHKLLQVNFGLVLILLLAVLRFFDGDLSIVVRGVFFVLAGAGFILGNYVALKKKNNEK